MDEKATEIINMDKVPITTKLDGHGDPEVEGSIGSKPLEKEEEKINVDMGEVRAKMQEGKAIIGNTSKVGIKTLNEYCKEKHLSIIFNKKNQICGFRKNDYSNKEEKKQPELNIKKMFTFPNYIYYVQ